MITLDQLKHICPSSSVITLQKYVEPINRYMVSVGGITSTQRLRHFIAQVAHESGCFRYVLEIYGGEAYNNRPDLGNIMPGDGPRFRGRGLIQITGRTNYEQCSMALFGNKRLLDTPELLEQPVNAVRSAMWFWNTRGLNALADSDDIRAVTRRINGGYNGLDNRKTLYERAKNFIP